MKTCTPIKINKDKIFIDVKIMAINIKDNEIDDLNQDIIKEFLENELKKFSNIEIDYILAEGPFDKFS